MDPLDLRYETFADGGFRAQLVRDVDKIRSIHGDEDDGPDEPVINCIVHWQARGPRLSLFSLGVPSGGRRPSDCYIRGLIRVPAYLDWNIMFDTLNSEDGMVSRQFCSSLRRKGEYSNPEQERFLEIIGDSLGWDPDMQYLRWPSDEDEDDLSHEHDACMEAD